MKKLSKKRKLTRKLININRCLGAIYQEQYSQFSLTRGQHSFLIRIYENPGINQEGISSLIKVDRSTTTKAISKLCRQGLITKTRKKNNKKEWELNVTEEGERIILELEPFLDKTQTKIYKGLSQEELSTLSMLLSKVEENALNEWAIRKEVTDL